MPVGNAFTASAAARVPVSVLLGRPDHTKTFRQGVGGLALDYTLEARPWGVPLGQIRVPIEVWHGEDDRLVSPRASRILAEALPAAATHFVPGAGHLLNASDHVTDVLLSALSGSRR